jgi:hypothetical protein
MPQFSRPSAGNKKTRIAAGLFIVGVARIELATPAMSTQRVFQKTVENSHFVKSGSENKAMINGIFA